MAAPQVPGSSPLPAFRYLLANGARAQAMLPAFPSKTFPNHYTIATGLFPAWNGIIANTFTLRNASGAFPFNMQNKDPNFWMGEPIWLTAQKAGLVARTTGWPGSEVALHGWNPSKTAATFNYSQSGFERVDAVLALLRSSSGPPAFTSLYLNDVDDWGHAAGPDSDAVETAIAAVDASLWRLLQGLNASNLLSSTHILVTSDHGMAQTCGCGRTIPLTAVLPSTMAGNASAVAAIVAAGAADGPFIGIPCDGCSLQQARALATAMNAAASSAGYGPVFTASAKQDLPARFTGYGASSRVWPVIGLPAPGYVVASPPPPGSTAQQGCAGTHGWDTQYSAMHATLLGMGPRFAAGALLAPPAGAAAAGVAAGWAVPNVEVYGIMAEIMGIAPAPNNGTAGYATRVLLPRC